MQTRFPLTLLVGTFWHLTEHVEGETATSFEEKTEINAEDSHQTDSTLLLLVLALLVLSVLTIWLFKVKRFRWMHESGLCMIYGMLVGLIIKYAGGVTTAGYSSSLSNVTVAPQTLWMRLLATGRTYSYSLRGPLQKHKGSVDNLENKAVFDPEVFFYALLPPIIFFAGYDMKKRFFFRNLGAIITFAFVGTAISCLAFGGLIYGFIRMVGQEHYKGFAFHESLLFGSLISATDPVTVLAIFHDLNVDVDLYAIVFGESVLNDAVAIVFYRSVQHYQQEEFNAGSFVKAVGEFVGVFGGSFVLGSACGLGTALLTKLTHIRQFPKLETALFFMMSYGTFLLAEVLSLTGIVAVLFCGLSQAHYTYNNMSKESQVATKEIFGLLNFLAESFIFVYMGLSIFTFEEHQWKPDFICWSFFAVAVGRFLNIYPLSFLLNLKRSKRIPLNFQHMLFFAGLRGAVAFALAIRNTSTEARQLMLTTTLVIVVGTVLFNGGLTTQALLLLKIRVNVDPDEEISTEVQVDSSGVHEDISYERSFLVRKWHAFDVRYMKPLFTNRGGSAYDALPQCCGSFAGCLTSPELKQQHFEENQRKRQSADDLRFLDTERHDILAGASPISLPVSDNPVPDELPVSDSDIIDLGFPRLQFQIEART